MNDNEVRDWHIAEVLTEPRDLFVLWAIATHFCTSPADFHHHYGADFPIAELIDSLKLRDLLQHDGELLVLTQAGEEAVAELGPVELSEFADLARPAPDVERRFSLNGSTPDESTLVELPLVEQLKTMGWQHLPGDVHVPYLTERESFRETLLHKRLRAQLRHINRNEKGEYWLDDARLNTIIASLDRLGAAQLMEANAQAWELLHKGTLVEGEAQHGGRDTRVNFIDWERPERNEFLVVNQFRVDVPGRRGYIVPDAVLFVNGIPLVVIECKSPAVTEPMQAAIAQLRRYANARDEVESNEGNERLFHTNAFVVATHWFEARAGTIGALPEHFLEWKDTSPVPMSQVCEELGVESLSSQQTLVAGMLRPEHLLDIAHFFTLFQESGGKTVKMVARYQQFRAVQESIRRLQLAPTQTPDAEHDGRGGIIWHTQGSGKSLTMVFLIRMMRAIPALRGFKVVVVTDRTDLEDQLRATATLTGETIRPSQDDRRRALTLSPTSLLKRVLSETGPDLVFAMIQKRLDEDEAAEEGAVNTTSEAVNDSRNIVLLVDEAHRSQNNTLHAVLTAALPNAAKIAFTGTPIIAGERKHTQNIFGSFIDIYTIQQSEADGATVPILYEGRMVRSAVDDGRTLDELVEAALRERKADVRKEIRGSLVKISDVLGAEKLIYAKAHDIFRHYVENGLPNGFKAQVVAVSRRAAVRYQQFLMQARDELLGDLRYMEEWNKHVLELSDEELGKQDESTRFMVHAYAHRDLIARLESAAVISHDEDDDPTWKSWSDKEAVRRSIERFKKPLSIEGEQIEGEQIGGEHRTDALAFLCVKSMLLTGFDAPFEQALYLDRILQGHELLQAIARVNRTAPDKTHGLVVDYVGLANHLQQALAVYNPRDVQGALDSIGDELPVLADRHQRVLALFQERGIASLSDVDAAVNLLRDEKIRADFVVKFRKFTQSLDIVLPRPQALHFVRDAKLLGFIHKSAANLYRDSELNLAGIGHKVRELIDRHIIAQGIDPKVSPVSILDQNFDAVVEGHGSDRTKASEMQHAARHYIHTHFPEDPARFKKLSERLEEILHRFQENWSAQADALREFTAQVRVGRVRDDSGLEPETQAPFLDILREELDDDLDYERVRELAARTVELVKHIRQEIAVVDFWRNPVRQNQLRAWIVTYLDDQDMIPLRRQQHVADRLMELAKVLHTKLTA